jgi:hypothetical protein
MGMRKSSRHELNKLREIAHFLLGSNDGRTLTQLRRCYFCHRPVVDAPAGVRHGEGTGAPLVELLDVTIHHIDGDHFHDAQRNKALAHAPCHQRHHLAERHRIAKAVQVDGVIVVVRHDELRVGDVLAATKFTLTRVRRIRGRIALEARHPLTRKTTPLSQWRNPATTIRVIRAA